MFERKRIFFKFLAVALFIAVLTILTSGMASGDVLKADIVVGTMEVGRTTDYAGDIPHHAYIYAATGEADRIFVIDPYTISLVAHIPVGATVSVHRIGNRRHNPLRAPEPMSLNHDGTRLFTANEGDMTISVIDTMARRELATMPVDGEPESILFNDDRRQLYVGIEDKDKVLVIDPDTLSVVSAIPVGKNPDGLALSGDRSKLFVTNEGDNTVSVIGTGLLRVIDTIKAGDKPSFILSSPASDHIYVVNDKTSDVSVIDMATHKTLGTVKVGTEPESAALNAAGTTLYVCNEADKTVSVIDTGSMSVISLINIEGEPESIAVDPVRNNLYVYDESHNAIRVIDGSTLLPAATLTLGPLAEERPALDVGILAPSVVKPGEKTRVMIEVKNEIPATSYVDSIMLYDGNTLLREWKYTWSDRRTEQGKWHLAYEGSFTKPATLRAEAHSSDGRRAGSTKVMKVT